MKPLDIETKLRPEHKPKQPKQNTVTVLFIYEGGSWMNGRNFTWKRRYPSLTAANQAIEDAKKKGRNVLKLLSAEIV